MSLFPTGEGMDKEQDLSVLLDAIVWGHRIVTVEDDLIQNFIFRPLSLQERNMANYIYDCAKKAGAKKGILESKTLLKNSIARGCWKSEYDRDLILLRTELSARLDELTEARIADEKRQTALVKAGLSSNTDGKYIRIMNRVQYLRHVISQLEEQHALYIELPSIEYYAERERSTYALGRCTLKFPSMEPVWCRHEDLLDEEDKTLVANLMRLFFASQIADEADIRRLARSGLWRTKWLASKKNRGVKTLFGIEMYDLTVDQFHLVYWSQIYDSAFEAMEPPSDDVIDNDKLFDLWLEEQADKRKQERKKSELDKRAHKLKKDGQEFGISVNGYFCEECTCGMKQAAKERGTLRLGHLHAPSCPHGVFIYYNEKRRGKEVENIQSGNPEHMRRRLAKEQEHLANKDGAMAEQDLRRSPKARAAFGMSTKIIGSDGPHGRAR